MGNTEKPGVVNHTRAALPSDPLQVPRTSGRRETWLMDYRVEQRAPRPHDRITEIVITQRTRPQAYCMGSHANSPVAGRHFRYAVILDDRAAKTPRLLRAATRFQV